ncbi:glycoside hydrolase family 18 protein [Dokdonella fugitiva]|uniref:glycoside hydrolase family 18 protein n=1 Tax=Dokdonella fugitiva TaxID=328517 RepID=UPI0015F9FD44|nr:glycoside hydrolase family 18 protein [Dokdonella fugitiva]MBA8883714.1 chitinase [Dokdonella fugitiva]
MRTIQPTLAAIAIAIACTAPVQRARAADAIFADGFEPARWVLGYYVGYERTLLAPADIPFDAVTHLMVGRVRPLASGAVTNDFDIDGVNGPAFAHAAVDAAHAAGRKAILMVGGAGEVDGWRGAASAAHQPAFVTNLLARMDQYGLDGLDLDWEPLEDDDKPAFQALATALRAARPHMLLTVPVGWFNPNYMEPDPFWAAVAPLFDRIDIMTYDMAGAASQGWDGWQSWHNSALYNTDPPTVSTPSAVDVSFRLGFLPTGVPASKLGIGLAFYGYCWQGVTGPHQDGGSISSSDGTMSYATIATQYPVATTRQWDATARVPYLSSVAGIGAQGCNFVSYDDAQSVTEKGAYAKAHGIGGVIIWTIGQGHVAANPPGSRDPLLDALRGSYLPQGGPWPTTR